MNSNEMIEKAVQALLRAEERVQDLQSAKDYATIRSRAELEISIADRWRQLRAEVSG